MGSALRLLRTGGREGSIIRAVLVFLSAALLIASPDARVSEHGSLPSGKTNPAEWEQPPRALENNQISWIGAML